MSSGTARSSRVESTHSEGVLVRDDWLSDRLGRGVYALVGEPVEPPGPAFVFAKVPVDDVARLALLEQAGFRVVDVNVSLTYSGGECGAPVFDVGPWRTSEGPQLVAIAESSFTFSRFHLDPEIPKESADRVKAEWIRSYIEGSRGLELLAARIDQVPVGFLAVLESSDARVIDLIGVASAQRGRGAGRALVQAFVHRHYGSANELQVGTQIANLPSLRLYQGLGFVISEAAYVLHRHVGAP
jgi:ribosomal protein S18 acetylase RimI-like enzyme